MRRLSFIQFTNILLSILLTSCSSVIQQEIVTITETEKLRATETSTPEPSATITLNPSPTSTNTITATPTFTPTPVFPIGGVIHFEKNDQFEYDWFLYIPRSVIRSENITILLSGVHGNIWSPNYRYIVDESEKMAYGKVEWAKELNSILIVPVIPKYLDYQPYDFDLLSFDVSSDFFYQRPDIKINKIIDYVSSELMLNGYKIDNRIIIEGFSSGGMFGQRYALLHPERVKAIAVGHCGGTFILPEEEFEGNVINWPVGINNYLLLTGYEFNRSAYKEIKQFIFVGEEDDNTTLSLQNSYSLWESQAQINFIHKNFGDSTFEILKNQISYLNEIGYEDILFKSYTAVGHEYTSLMAKYAINFLKRYK